jgi:twitching motility protein PilJ
MIGNKVTSKLPENRGATVLVVLLVGAIAAFITTAYMVVRDTNYDARYLELAGDLRVMMQEVSTASRQAIAGDAQAFDDLENARQGLDQTLQVFNKGAPGLPSPKHMLNKEIGELNTLWAQTDGAAQTVVANRERILFLHEVARNLNASIPELQQEYDFVVDILIENGASPSQIAIAQKQVWLAERIARNVEKMLQGTADAKEAADIFNLDASMFGTVLTGMREGNSTLKIQKVRDTEASQSLDQIAELYGFVNNFIDKIFQASPDLSKARDAGNILVDKSPVMQEATSALAEHIGDLSSERTVNGTLVLVSGVAIILLMSLLGLQGLVGTRKRLGLEEATNSQNQVAILRLLDELANLADGDLTTTATVSEDFTGAIADSINFTIDQLRVLVSQINDTALRVTSASQETQSTALHLAEAAEHQAQEIAGASAAINEMAVTIDQVSSNASESAQVAERSVKIASTGAEVVQNTIRGMDTIREQIQDTSKRIKRLGESSQEIGDIVSLINDIADQTNILSLNAAIQASMAGDAGRGFAVVADEVQRLAERASGATKQIEALVKTIQSDTNEAVISMEQTTAEVVRGARLAQDAGVALEEIENVSTSLSDLIQNISNAARQQAASAGHVSNTMNVIQEITSQTSAGTTATAGSIGRLAELAGDMQKSVAGFKLPNEHVQGELHVDLTIGGEAGNQRKTAGKSSGKSERAADFEHQV